MQRDEENLRRNQVLSEETNMRLELSFESQIVNKNKRLEYDSPQRRSYYETPDLSMPSYCSSTEHVKAK